LKCNGRGKNAARGTKAPSSGGKWRVNVGSNLIRSGESERRRTGPPKKKRVPASTEKKLLEHPRLKRSLSYYSPKEPRQTGKLSTKRQIILGGGEDKGLIEERKMVRKGEVS